MTRSDEYYLSFKELVRLHKRSFKAQQFGHFEVCGLLLMDRTRQLSFLFMENQGSEPYTYSLEISAIEVVSEQVRRDGKAVIGSFHSHPISEAEPGSRDLECGFYLGRELIYDVCGREPVLWRFENRTLIREKVRCGASQV
ncbi:MAG: Mov34/MPN/PAD-1 family protein [Pseudomonadota bacterium]